MQTWSDPHSVNQGVPVKLTDNNDRARSAARLLFRGMRKENVTKTWFLRPAQKRDEARAGRERIMEESVLVDYEIVCLDENGGISRAVQGTYTGLDSAVAVAAAKAPSDCSRILLCAMKTNFVVWEGSRADALAAAARSADELR